MGARMKPDRPGRSPQRSRRNPLQRVASLIMAKSLIALIVCQVCADLLVSGMAPLQVEAVSVAEPTTVRSRSAHGHSFVLSLSADGEFALFASSANDILTNDQNAGFVDLFLWRRSDGSVRLVSANVFGAGGGGGHTGHAEVTPDGRYVVFESAGDDLVPNDSNQATDVFVRDMLEDKVVLVSVNATGTASGNGASWNPVITPDGRFVAFVSSASDLVPRDNNRIADVFLRDLQAGVTTLVSHNARSRSSPPYAVMDSPVITPDGRFVAFSSSAIGLVNIPQPGYQEIYVRDLLLERTIWASTNLAALGATGFYAPVLSDDGRFAAFKAAAGADLRPWLGVARLFRHDLEAGRSDVIPWNIVGIGPTVPDGYGPAMTPDGGCIVFTDTPTIIGTSSVRLWDAGSGDLRLVSANLAGQPTVGGLCDRAVMTVDGRRIAFASNASDLVTNELRTGFQVYLRDMDSGLTTLVSADFGGAGVGGVDLAPVISANGRFVGFETISDGLAPDDLNATYDAFLYDSVTGTTELISRANPGCKVVTGNNSSFVTSKPVSDDGRLVVFESLACDIVAGDTNGVWDIFVRDLIADTSGLVSVNIAGTVSTTGASRSPSISGSGRYVVFISTSEDLVVNDTNRVEDVFVRDLIAGRTTLVSVTPEGYSGNGPSFAASISEDGRWVAFQSLANNLSPGDGDLIDDIYVRDLESGVTALISANAPEDHGSMTFSNPIISPDGRFVAFQAVLSSARTVRVVNLEDKSTHKIATNAPDNNGLFPPNPDDGNMFPGYNWCAGQAGPGMPQEFNSDILSDPNLCLVSPYLAQNVTVFRCTLDPRTGQYTGTDPSKRGTIVPCARSISMNGAVGTLPYEGFRPVDGPWLDNNHTHRRNKPWRTFGRTTDVIGPTPAQLWVLIEEDPASVNDAAFAVGMNRAQWLDWPGTLHDFGCCVGFADGHTELHKWTDVRTRVTSGKVSRLEVPGSKDWLWLSQRTSARAN